MSERPTLDLTDIARALIDSADDAIVTKDLDGIIRSWNRAAERMFGYSAAEAVGQPVTLLIPPELHDEEADILARLRRGERIEHYETTRVAKDGRRLPVSLTISPIPDRSGRIIGASKIARDISERRRAEAFRRAKTAELRAIIEAMPAAVLIAEDAECRSVRANRAGYELLLALGGGNAAATGARDREASGSLDDSMPLARDLAPLQRAAAGEAVHDWQERVRLADGALHHFHGLAVPLPDEEGRARGAVAALLDITPRVQSEQALHEADRRKDEFLAMLAHELRNPLAPIRTGLEIVQRKIIEPERREWALQVIDRQLTQLTRIIDDLLELARIASGKIALAREPTTLRTVVTRAIESARPLINARRHVLRVDLPLTDVPLYVDSARLAEALANLLSNAAKFTEAGGTIAVAAETGSEEVAIKVCDNGRGIEAELLPRVFDIFVQGPQSLARYEGGLGVGLAVVRRIVEMHGGSVTAQSRGGGQGSEFLVTLPLAQTRPVEPGAPEPQPAAGAQRRVLIVDDNRDAADTLAEALRFEGHEVASHYEGVGVMRKVREFRPDVVIVDLGLPGRDGYEVARELRADADTGHLPLVAVSGYGQPDDMERSRDAGLDAHLVKPVDSRELARVIASCRRPGGYDGARDDGLDCGSSEDSA